MLDTNGNGTKYERFVVGEHLLKCTPRCAMKLAAAEENGSVLRALGAAQRPIKQGQRLKGNFFIFFIYLLLLFFISILLPTPSF